VSAFAYDPVQSLLAVGTSESQFGPGIIYVFGQKRVCHTFNPPRKSSVRQLQFCANRLLSLDSKNDVSVFSLETGKLVASYAPPGHVMALVSDPSLDYCLIGLQNGRYEFGKERAKVDILADHASQVMLWRTTSTENPRLLSRYQTAGARKVQSHAYCL